MGHKEFTSGRADELEGPSFSVDGQKFRCLPQPPHGFIADLLESRNENFYSAAAMRRFVRGALIPEDEQTWDELQYAKQGGVDLGLLGEIFEYLVGEMFKRPTQPPSGSPDGRNTIEATSTDASPSPAESLETSTT